jgi:hypothetical protein
MAMLVGIALGVIALLAVIGAASAWIDRHVD